MCAIFIMYFVLFLFGACFGWNFSARAAAAAAAAAAGSGWGGACCCWGRRLLLCCCWWWLLRRQRRLLLLLVGVAGVVVAAAGGGGGGREEGRGLFGCNYNEHRNQVSYFIVHFTLSSSSVSQSLSFNLLQSLYCPLFLVLILCLQIKV